MPKIKQLHLHEAKKISEGEVVERPANAVKELIENAIDAGATTITIFIEDAGKQLIRVIDNGCGMSKEDALLCFDHHATSKISSVNDLSGLQTFGFRGEALSSISAVSKVTLTTKELADQEGYYIERENNSNLIEKSVACNTGTSITIADLFFNVPARKKFLKTKDTEWRAISLMFQAFCLDYQTIHFKLYSENSLIFNCPIAKNLNERIGQLWQYSPHEMLMLTPINQRGVSVQGAISHQHIQRYDRSHIYIFVNNRWIKNQHLVRAVLKGYMNVLPDGRYPTVCLFISVPQDQVDINIHPRKEEVQFLHPKIVENFISEAIRKTLEQYISTLIRPTENQDYFQKKQSSFENNTHTQIGLLTNSFKSNEKFVHPSVEQQDFSDNNANNSYDKNLFLNQKEVIASHDFQDNSISTLFSSQPPDYTLIEHNHSHNSPEKLPECLPKEPEFLAQIILSPENSGLQYGDEWQNSNFAKASTDRSFSGVPKTTAFKPCVGFIQPREITQSTYRIIGQYKSTYVLIEKSDGLFFIDQHAAHERILYEQYLNRFHEISAITLLFPETIELSADEFTTIIPYLDFFKNHGLELEHFGKHTLLVKSTATHLKNQSIPTFIKESIALIQSETAHQDNDFLNIIHHKLRSQMACKAAVKAGDILTIEQMSSLLSELDLVENRFTCPHGRPTGWHLPLREIEKKFKRIA